MPEKNNNEFVFPANLALAIEDESSFSEQQKINAYAALCRYLIFETEPIDITLRMFCKAVKVSIENEKKRKEQISELKRNCVLQRWNKKINQIENQNDDQIENITPENKFITLTDNIEIRNALSDSESGLNFFLATGSGYDELTVAEREFVDRADVREKCTWHKEMQAAAKAIKRKSFCPPTLEEWMDFCREKNLNLEKMRNAYEGYVAADWHDTQGSPIRNWKQKILMVWASRPDNYNTQTANFARPTEMEKLAKGAKIAEAMLKKQGII